MNFANVRLILAREIRDQSRDRRTLFVMFVLPVLLYPVMGMSFVQISQFMREEPVRVLVVGAKHLPDDRGDGVPPLVANNRFAAELFSAPEKVRLLELEFAADEPRPGAPVPPDPCLAARAAVEAGQYDAAICFPEEFADALATFQQAIGDGADPHAEALPRPEIIYTTANEKSQVAFIRLSTVLERWTAEVGKENLRAGGVPVSAARPFSVESTDVAGETAYRGAAMWSKILPVMLLIWALTGAFYPAVDLCAGEKERGTLETLLSSPARRSEIVLGKLLTIMLFSMVTAVLNLASVGVTGWLVLGGRAEFGPPPPLAPLWLALALLPMSALFSALCLALAAFARSSKEGQYYLMPLLVITLPLAVFPMAPGVELTLGNSLIPVAGVVLVLRSLLEGNYMPALQFLPVVMAVTLASCLLAVRWAVDQFNSETVLFREGERLDVRLWLQHLVRDRKPTPTVGAAIFCGVLILVLQFFVSASLQPSGGFAGLAKAAMITQLVVIFTPALLMTIILTKSPRKTLLLKSAPWLAVPAAVLLAVLLHPLATAMQVFVVQLYPPTEQMESALRGLSRVFREAPLWQKIGVLALVPAVCEELTFRGFILSGFRHLGHKWRAIVWSAVFFGVTHAILQQSLLAFLMGLVIGYLAVQSGSIWPCMVFHFCHNSLILAFTHVTSKTVASWPLLDVLLHRAEGGNYVYRTPVLVLAACAAAAVLYWFSRLSYRKSPEEKLQQAIARGAHTEESACGFAE